VAVAVAGGDPTGDPTGVPFAGSLGDTLT
jgi:hypothetical protein